MISIADEVKFYAEQLEPARRDVDKKFQDYIDARVKLDRLEREAYLFYKNLYRNKK